MNEKREVFKVLVIDDHEYIQKIIKMSLETMKSWEVITVSNFDDGINKVKNQSINVILLDYLLPDITGEEMLNKLEGNPFTRNIPIILLTAHSQNKITINKGNLKGIISKPFNPLELGDCIDNILKSC